jgi:lipoyl(octanoyl) transferase
MGAASDSLFSPHRKTESLDVHLLGVVDFDAALALQKHLVYEISGRSDRFGTLLLCEHPPTITIGREGSRSDVFVDERELTSRNLDVRWLNRGGGAVMHGPGQLAVYPILPLDRLHCGLRDFRRRLESSVIATCRELQVSAWTAPESPGVACRCGQFAFLGAAVKSWVSYHGLFVNVSPRLDLMRLVRSAAAAGSRVSSLAAQRVRPTSMHSVREAMVRHIAAEFGYSRFHVHTGHPLLKRERRRVPVYA